MATKSYVLITAIRITNNVLFDIMKKYMYIASGDDASVVWWLGLIGTCNQSLYKAACT